MQRNKQYRSRSNKQILGQAELVRAAGSVERYQCTQLRTSRIVNQLYQQSQTQTKQDPTNKQSRLASNTHQSCDQR
ncbi:hypothetical protein PCASD_14391, partial [Puccinia coronata f. sp. avenae]